MYETESILCWWVPSWIICLSPLEPRGYKIEFPSGQSFAEIKDEARCVGLSLKEYDSLWTEQGWSSARKSSGLSRKTPPAKEAQTTSTSTSDPVKNPRPTETKSRKSHGLAVKPGAL
jgi:hypothetical protein